MKRIAVDMDGVLANTVDQLIKYDYADTASLKTINDLLGKGELESFIHAQKHLRTPGFFRELPVIDGSQQVMEQLNNTYDIFIVSSATEFPQCLSEKQAWLNEHFPFIKWQQMVFCGVKSIIHADIMIDDNFRNLDPFAGETILFNQPHTQLMHAGRHKRVYSWAEIGSFLAGTENNEKEIHLTQTA